MKSIFLFIAFITFNNVVAQERISEVESQFTNSRFFVQEVDSIKYVVLITSCDSLITFKINEDGTKEQLHSYFSFGSYERPWPIFDENYYLNSFENVAFVYDFTTGLEKKYELPDSISVLSFIHMNNGKESMVHIKNSMGTTYYGVLNYDMGFSSDPVYDPSRLYYNYRLRAYLDERKNGVLVLHDHDNEIIDTVFHNNYISQEIYVRDSIVYYLDNGSEFLSYNLRNGQRKLIVKLGLNLLDKNDIIIKDQKLYLFSSDFNHIHFICYDIIDDVLLSNYLQTLWRGDSFSDVDVVNDRMIYSSPSSIFVFNTLSETLFERELEYYFSDYYIKVFDDQYFLFSGNDNNIGVYNLLNDNFNAISPNESHDFSRLDGLMIEDSLIVFKQSNYSYSNYFSDVLIIENTAFSDIKDYSFNDSNSGFTNFSDLIKLANGICVLDGTKAYKTNDNENLELFFSGPLRVDSEHYKLDNEILYFIDAESFDLMSFDGENVKFEINLASLFNQPYASIDSYFISKDKVYIDASLGLIMADLTSNEISIINSNSFDNNRNSDFYNTGDDVYVLNNSQIFHLGDVNNIARVGEEINIVNVPFSFQNKLITIDSEGVFYAIEGKSVTPINEDHDTYQNIVRGASVYNLLDEVIFFINYDRVLVYDGISFFQYETTGYILGSLENDMSLTNNIISLTLLYDDYIETLIFDLEKKQFKEFARESIFDSNAIYLSSSDTLYLEQKFYDKIYGQYDIVRYSNYFENADIIDTVYSNSITGYDYYIGGDDQYIVLGDKFFQMDNGSLVEIDVKAFGGQSDITHYGGYIYFFGDDKNYGKQVFRYKSILNSTDESHLDVSTKHFKILPNPTTDYLMVERDGVTQFGSFHYSIFDVSGRELMNGQTESNRVDIRTLSEGMYFIGIKTDTNIMPIPFIKL